MAVKTEPGLQTRVAKKAPPKAVHQKINPPYGAAIRRIFVPIELFINSIPAGDIDMSDSKNKAKQDQKSLPHGNAVQQKQAGR